MWEVCSHIPVSKRHWDICANSIKNRSYQGGLQDAPRSHETERQGARDVAQQDGLYLQQLVLSHAGAVEGAVVAVVVEVLLVEVEAMAMQAEEQYGKGGLNISECDRSGGVVAASVSGQTCSKVMGNAELGARGLADRCCLMRQHGKACDDTGRD